MQTPVTPNSGAPAVSETTNYRFALTMLTALFFAWGFIICLNDILIPHLKRVFDLNYVQAALVQFCFFLAFFVMSVPSGFILNRIGYQRGIVVGLLVSGLGALLFLPAASIPSYGFFLAALFILATGITLLQVAANPYVVLLGPPALGSSRLNLAQAVNSLGTTIAPVLGGILILRAFNLGEGSTASPLQQAAAAKVPYFCISLALVALAVVFSVIRLPKIPLATSEKSGGGNGKASWREALQQPHLVLGAIGIFLYVGAEIAIGSFMVSFITQPYILGIPAKDAAFYVSLYWGGAMVGRFIGSLLQTKFASEKTLAFAASIALALVLGAVTSKGPVAMALLLAVGLFNSIMFPTIFTLGVRDLGPLTGVGSSLLVMAIVGGAVIPLGMGALADRFGIQASLLLPALCYVYIFYYAIRGFRLTIRIPASAARIEPVTSSC
jgi:FHS family L-fucose permease-like MFS transporter